MREAMLIPLSPELCSTAALPAGLSLRRRYHPTASTSLAALRHPLPLPSSPCRLHCGVLISNAPSPLPLRRRLPSTKRASLVAVEPSQQEEEEEEGDEGEAESEDAGRPLVQLLSDGAAERDMRSLPSPPVEVRELEEFPEQWRRAKIAWLCKELPSHKNSTYVRILNAQRKWITQEDATYIALHFMRTRDNEASFRVYKWMAQRHWFRFDFALATKLADYLGKDRKFTKCREMFDAIINQGRIPSESTFHILTVAYLSAPVEGCLEEACIIYNKMIQLGGYKPRLSLHNSLFRALVRKTGGSSKHYLKQAEFIYHNLVTSDLEIHKDIYAGLIWLHSYQDVIDRERISALREEMRHAKIEESKDVLLSIMRACSKEGDVEETERTWLKLLESGCSLPSQAFVYRMDLYARANEPMKSLEIYKGMKEQKIPISVAAYHKIIEVMSNAREVDIAEELIDDFIESGMKPLMPAYLNLMHMYFHLGMHDKLELTFSRCLTRCSPNRTIYNIYLKSLVTIGNLEKADEIFNEMHENGTIGTNARSCNTILRGFLALEDHVKVAKIHDIMRQKKYDVEPQSLEKLHYVLSQNRKVVRRTVSMKLDQEQREILIGLLLGGVRMESDVERRNHAIHFEFDESSNVHSALRAHIHERFYEWLTPSSRLAEDDHEIPYRFSTILHSYFGFFADQFWLKGRPMIPKLIHRWLSARVLAYWYMYGGFRISSGDILLKMKGGNREDVERIVKALQAKSLACRVKRKGKVFWIGLQGSNADAFWKLTESYVLVSVKNLLAPGDVLTGNGREEGQFNDSQTESEPDEQGSV
ncbi:pentatricopeptide repeat-containing protein OTP51, chloroplastic [Elaeis guineensis]|uniref:pentatricopeptide repeat-containing protein OTP51, chloroplastic n=1 Tax=Elaeis guineensis var. tenera TaxID=51953 RepID=UPI003C6D464C